MILIELNEFNPDLLRAAAEQFQLDNLRQLCDFAHTETDAEEREERFGLDPWVQWPSIHTGKTSAEHGLHHLADAYKLTCPQVWDTLASNGVTSGIWGAMNARFNRHDNLRFFFPDPWTYTETASEPALNRLLALPRYYARHYLALSKIKLFSTFCNTASFFLNPALLGKALTFLPFATGKLISQKIGTGFLFSAFDLINAIGFRHYCLRNQVDFKLVFLNSVAHCQHHCWTDADSISPELQTMFEFLDRSVGLILEVAKENEPIVVANAFSQYCSIENNEFLYRQIDPASFFQSIGLDTTVEQLMTNDSQLRFADATKASAAAALLQSYKVAGKDLFQASIDSEDDKRVFCQVLVWDDIAADEYFHNSSERFRFYDHFEKVVRRSGSHVAKGIVLSRGIKLPETMLNYQLHDYILENYGVRQ